MNAAPEAQSHISPPRIPSIPPQAFHLEMLAFWTRPRTEQDQYGLSGLGNVYSMALGEVWSTLASAINAQIDAHDDPEERHRFSILGPECGVGKTVGSAVAISMLPQGIDHPGVLYVCQRKVQADDVAALVNARAGAGTAFAYHEDHKCSTEEMRSYPVLVMTHSMFSRVAEAVLDNRPLSVAYGDFTAWGVSGRKLCIVDEAFQAIEDYEVHPERLAELLAAYTGNSTLRQTFAPQIEVLETVLSQALGARDRRKAMREQDFDAPSNLTVRPEPLRIPDVDFTEFKKTIPKLRLRGGGKYGDVQAKRSQTASDLETLRNVLGSIRTWAYYTEILRERGPAGILHSSRLILPDSIRGALFLDATADTTIAYRLFPEKRQLRMWNTKPARSYRNLTLRASYGHATGARERTNLKQDVREFMAALRRDVPSDARVLVVTHKSLAYAFADHRGPEVDGTRIPPHFAAFDVMTWGSIDGSNAWQDYDTIAVFTHFHLPTRWATGTYMALQGLQEESWLNEYQDILAAIHEGHLVSSMVQAIGRIRCRRVVDTLGNCSPATVYLVLGNKAEGEALVSSIRGMLPDLPEAEPWTFTGALQKGQRPAPQYAAALLSLMTASEPRWWSATDVRERIGMTASQWVDFASDMRNPRSTLFAKLAEIGVRYHVEGKGRGSRSWLVKEQVQ